MIMHVCPNYNVNIIKKFHNYIKKFSSSHKYKKNFLFAKYKNDKFIIK